MGDGGWGEEQVDASSRARALTVTVNPSTQSQTQACVCARTGTCDGWGCGIPRLTRTPYEPRTRYVWLGRGHRATLRVTLRRMKKGSYVCDVPGRAHDDDADADAMGKIWHYDVDESDYEYGCGCGVIMTMTMDDGSMRRDHEDGDDDAGDETTMRMMSDER